MKYKGYKLEFTTAIHLGMGKLTNTSHTLYADTLFSALCHEGLQQGGEDLLNELIELVCDGKLLFSDGFPYYENVFYVPKPMLPIEEENRDASKKKASKKLEYIPEDKVCAFLSGGLDLEQEVSVYRQMGTHEVRTMSSISGNTATPFSVGTYSFRPGWGLYFLIGYENDADLYLIEDLLIGLGYSGIGGKRSGGLGKFILKQAKLSDLYIQRLCTATESKQGTYMSLSVSMARDEEVEQVIKDANFSLVKRSGFVASSTYADRPVKKRDAYVFKSGSVFTKTFEGCLLDVSGQGAHPVYRYGKPIFMEVER